MQWKAPEKLNKNVFMTTFSAANLNEFYAVIQGNFNKNSKKSLVCNYCKVIEHKTQFLLH